MELKLYDTLTKDKRAFAPLDPANVRMYVCGPTVYDYAHIGNARPVIVFDVLFRLLRHIYGADRVTYVRNITDVDDKINDRAARDYPGLPLNEAIRKVTEQTEKQFHEDAAALGCLAPTVEPRATEHIPEMRAIIDQLIADGHAYVGEDHVLFSVASMKDYGRLARRSLDEMLAGARVDIAPYKREAMDFVLWKPSKEGEPAWASPAGIKTPGRPGWHLECSAMSDRWLWTEAEPRLSANGKAHPHQFDIHGGGIDLVFPHHENEIAQSCCAFHTTHMARTWMHNGFLMVEGEKMSKSLGNFITIRELLFDWPGDVLRYTMLKTHYRQPIDWRRDQLQINQWELQKWAEIIEKNDLVDDYLEASAENVDSYSVAALGDDLNTPRAISRLHQLSQAVQERAGGGKVFASTLAFWGFKNLHRPGFFTRTIAAFASDAQQQQLTDAHHDVLKYRNQVANGFISAAATTNERLVSSGINIEISDSGTVNLSFVGGDTISLEERIKAAIATRAAARAAKDWKESDRIRDELLAMGVVLKDGKDSDGKPVTTWEVKR